MYTAELLVHFTLFNNTVTQDVALTNKSNQLFRVVPRTIKFALVLSTLTLLVTAEGECCTPTTTTSLIHLIPVVARHQLALWVVPLY